VAKLTRAPSMSAFGPKQTWPRALHMPAIGGKADITIAACLLLRSLLGVKRTWPFALHMSAYDPKRTWNPDGTFGRVAVFEAGLSLIVWLS
jgi:hypothetical protein